MNPALFESLLHEEEGQNLDFKEAQYPFAKATDEEKSELLKDVLAFANAWRRTEAYILIGVREVRGGRSVVEGIEAHDQLADHSLQQFVNYLTNRPVLFAYEAFTFEGEQIGIIRVEQQRRPIYLKKDYGKLKAKTVYIRRGSSTGEADLEEVSLMGQDSFIEQAELLVEFAELGRDASAGQSVSLRVEHCRLPDRIPSFQYPTRSGSPYLATIDVRIPNSNFYRQMAAFEFGRRLLRPVRIMIQNVGNVSASDVRVELATPILDDLRFVLAEGELPERPYRDRTRQSFKDMKIGKPRVSVPGEVNVRYDDEQHFIDVDCGRLQPGRRLWSEEFYVGSRQPRTITLAGKVYAENLPHPSDFQLCIEVEVEETEISLSDLKQMPDASEFDDG